MKSNNDERLIVQSNRLKNPCLIVSFIFELIAAIGLYLAFRYIPQEIADRRRELYISNGGLYTTNIELANLSKLDRFLRYGKWYLLGLSVVLLFFILYFICFKIVLTNKNLYGVKEFGKRVVIPVSDIKTVNIGGFHKLVVEGESRKNVFYGINNYRAICSEIQDLKYSSISIKPVNQNTDRVEEVGEQNPITDSSQNKGTLSCELCGGVDLLKQDGVFVCQNCGAKYTVEEARKLMSGTVAVERNTIKETRIVPDQFEDKPVYKPTPAFEKVRKVFITLGIIIILVGGAFIVYRKVHVKHMVSKAEKAVQNQDYDYARKYYDEALKWDEFNVEINRARNKLEGDLRRHDANLMADLHTALSAAWFDPNVRNSGKFKSVRKGDFGLYEFCRGRGTAFIEAVESNLGGQSIYNIRSNFLSRKYDGTPLRDSEIRIALYNTGKDGPLEMCVYVPGAESYAYGGVMYRRY